MTDPTTERQKFEEWFIEKSEAVGNTDLAWEAWLARAEQSSEAPPQWITVTEKLPITNHRVLIWFRLERNPEKWGPLFGEISCGHWRPEGGNGNFDEYVSHWMEAPSKPETPRPEGKAPQSVLVCEKCGHSNDLFLHLPTVAETPRPVSPSQTDKD